MKYWVLYALRFIGILCWIKIALADIITKKVLSENVDGLIAAFGDFNADKLTDVFFITDGGARVEIYFAQEKEPILYRSNINCSFSDYLITSVTPGDFDGNSTMDILLTLKKKSQDPKDRTVSFKILWGNLHNLSGCSFDEKELELFELKDQPFVLDYNADKIPDVYGELANGTRQVWLMKENRTFTTHVINSSNPLRRPHSNAFLDLNGDRASDILVTIEGNSFEIWYNYDSTFNNFTKVDLNIPNVKVVGQSAFLDVDSDGRLDHIVPLCFDEECKNSSIYVCINTKWQKLVDNMLKDEKDTWGFVNNFNQPITLRIGDYNLDGYPDMIAVLYKVGASPKDQKAVLFENAPCKGCQYSRRFTPQWNFEGLNSINNVTHVAFYDLYQDGNLDFLLVSEAANKKNKWEISAVQNSVTYDVCFIKVLVLSGLCYSDCPDNYKPYGVNQPGPFVSYKTILPDGTPHTTSAAQLSQSAYFALQLPYTVFGLGQTPNFVDDLTVGIPRSPHKEKHEHSWHSIIPNSQMVIIPLDTRSPVDYNWMNKLFVTPSHQVLLTFIALIGTCCLIILIIGGLYWKEKVADKKEKLLEAHRFHFDAM